MESGITSYKSNGARAVLSIIPWYIKLKYKTFVLAAGIRGLLDLPESMSADH